MTENVPAFLLEGCAFDPLLEDPVARARLVEAVERGLVTVLVTALTYQDLQAIKDVDRRNKLLALVEELAPQITGLPAVLVDPDAKRARPTYPGTIYPVGEESAELLHRLGVSQRADARQAVAAHWAGTALDSAVDPANVDTTAPLLTPARGRRCGDHIVSGAADNSPMHIRQILKDEAELARAKLAYAQERRSRLAQQMYADGYRAALEDMDRRPTFVDPHPQVELWGVEVDVGMAPLLEALWLLGLDTEFSCQGHPDRYIPNQEATHQWGAYVLFTRIEDAFTFLTKTIELLDYAPRTEGRMYLSPMATQEGQQTRASVSVPPALLDALTSEWIGFGKTITSSGGDIPPS